MAMTDTTSLPVFDSAHLAQYTSGDPDLGRELAGLLRDQATRSIAAMQAAGDMAAWQAAAHTLKGAARGMGAFALGGACERAEAATQANWPAALADVRASAVEALAAIDAALSS